MGPLLFTFSSISLPFSFSLPFSVPGGSDWRLSLQFSTLPPLGSLASLHSYGPFFTLWACGKDHSPPLCPLTSFAFLILLSLFLGFYLPSFFSFRISSHHCITPYSPSHKPSPGSLILLYFCPDCKPHHQRSYHNPDDPQLALRSVRTS